VTIDPDPPLDLDGLIAQITRESRHPEVPRVSVRRRTEAGETMTMHRRLHCAGAGQSLLRRSRDQRAANSGRWTRDDLYYQQEETVSTKSSIKYHNEEETPGRWFHLYNEVFDDNYIYLELGGVPFEASNCAYLDAGTGSGSVSVRIPNDWARRLGLIGNVNYLDNEEEDGTLLEATNDALSGGENESVEKMEQNVKLPAFGFAYTRPDGTIIVNSVRETRDAVRLAGAEGSPVPVMVTQMPDDSTVESLADHL